MTAALRRLGVLRQGHEVQRDAPELDAALFGDDRHLSIVSIGLDAPLEVPESPLRGVEEALCLEAIVQLEHRVRRPGVTDEVVRTTPPHRGPDRSCI